MRRAILLFSFAALGLGCECSPAPAGSTCRATSECTRGRVCIDGRCSAPIDAAVDAPVLPPADGDVPDAPITPRDAAQVDANCIPVTCAATEACFDGVDDDCDGHVDESCTCVPGSTARCLPGRPDPSTPRCAWGEMTCEGVSEFGAWGACTGGGTGDAGMTLYGCRRIGIMGAPGALASSDFQAWLEMQGAIVTRFHTAAGAGTLHVEELETFDLVVVDWLQRLYTAEEADVLAAWVNGGGALIAMTGHDSGATADRHVSLLASLGPSYDLAAGPIDGPATLLSHPTTDDGAGGTLPPVTFNGGLRVTIPASMAGTFLPMATIGADVVGAAGPIGSGRALLFGDEWIEFDSEWASMPPIPRFWQNSVEWASPDPMVLPACP